MDDYDLSDSIVAKSDQLNADDLLSGPRTFTIDHVVVTNSDQPVAIHLVEFPGRPFKPSKSMRRVLVAAYGPKSLAYNSHQITLYREASVRWAGQEVGGIRISAMTGLDKPLRLPLTIKKGQKDMYVVQPLKRQDKPTNMGNHLDDLLAAFDVAGIPADRRLDYCTHLLKRAVNSPDHLTPDDAQTVMDALKADAEPSAEPWAERDGGE